MDFQTHYFGKLRKTREFLISNTLNSQDRDFWELWFNRCGNGNQLMPFLKPKNSHHINTIWLFLVKSEQLIYIGLGSQSQDLTGRYYPFLLFSRLQDGTYPISDIDKLITYYSKHLDYFEQQLNQGYLLTDTDNFIQDTVLTEDYLIELKKILTSHIYQELYASNWYDLKTKKCITHCNALTCSLYTKIFG